MSRPVVKGWCPSALRPMASGDGLLVRVRPRGGILDPGLARRIAGWSSRWGNGAIDLSQRANLQLRGIGEDGLPALQAALSKEGLLDSRPNIMASPLAGLDPAAVLDIRPAVAALESRLAVEALPDKFGFLVDDGGTRGLGEAGADIRFEAFRSGGEPMFRIGLDGAAERGFGPCGVADLPDVALRLGRAFRRLSREHGVPPKRMRDLVAVLGADRVARAAGLEPDLAPPRAAAAEHLGAHPLGDGAFLGIGLPFGRISAEDLADLARSLAAEGGTELRLTPWRAMLAIMPTIGAAERLAAHSAPRPSIFDPRDPRRRIAACPGAPGCSQASRDLRQDAALLAPAIDDWAGTGILLHLSGCAKGCAHPLAAPVTLVGTAAGYALIRDGTAAADPVAQDLSPRQVADRLRAMVAAEAAA